MTTRAVTMRVALAGAVLLVLAGLWACSGSPPGKVYHQGDSKAYFGPNPNDR